MSIKTERPLQSYAEILRHLRSEFKTYHLLLGNGFSIGCDPIYSYKSLVDIATLELLTPEVAKTFKALGGS